MELNRFLVWYIAGYTLKHALQLRILLIRSVSRHFSVSVDWARGRPVEQAGVCLGPLVGGGLRGRVERLPEQRVECLGIVEPGPLDHLVAGLGVDVPGVRGVVRERREQPAD